MMVSHQGLHKSNNDTEFAVNFIQGIALVLILMAVSWKLGFPPASPLTQIGATVVEVLSWIQLLSFLAYLILPHLFLCHRYVGME